MYAHIISDFFLFGAEHNYLLTSSTFTSRKLKKLVIIQV